MVMISVPITNARKDFYRLVERVNEDGTPVTLTNSRGKNAVLIGEDDWNAISETLYLESVPGLAASILSGGEEPLEECVTVDNLDW